MTNYSFEDFFLIHPWYENLYFTCNLLIRYLLTWHNFYNPFIKRQHSKSIQVSLRRNPETVCVIHLILQLKTEVEEGRLWT